MQHEKDTIRSAHADGLIRRKVFYSLEQAVDDRLLELGASYTAEER